MKDTNEKNQHLGRDFEKNQTEMLEMKGSTGQLKIKFKASKTLHQADERTSELEEGPLEISQSKRKKYSRTLEHH
jgi:hypothetical protein